MPRRANGERKEVLSTKVIPGLKARAQEIAYAQGLSLSAFHEQALVEACDAHEHGGTRRERVENRRLTALVARAVQEQLGQHEERFTDMLARIQALLTELDARRTVAETLLSNVHDGLHLIAQKLAEYQAAMEPPTVALSADAGRTPAADAARPIKPPANSAPSVSGPGAAAVSASSPTAKATPPTKTRPKQPSPLEEKFGLTPEQLAERISKLKGSRS